MHLKRQFLVIEFGKDDVVFVGHFGLLAVLGMLMRPRAPFHLAIYDMECVCGDENRQDQTRNACWRW